MMIRKKLYTFGMAFCLTVCLPSLLFADVRFSTERLKGMASVMQLHGLENINPSSDIRDGYTYKGRSLHITTNRWGEISHIGYCLFDPGQYLVQPSPVYDFLERYLLELDLPSEFPISFRLEKDKIHVNGNLSLLASLDGSEEFVIEKRAYLKYRVCWLKEGKSILSISFDMDNQLMSGCLTMELERNLVRDMKRTPPFSTQFSGISENANITKAGSFYILHGRNYMNDQIRNDLYYIKQQDRFVLVEDAKHPMLSVPDILLTGQSVADYKMDICLDKYGYETETFTVTLKQWVAFCKEEGCEFYFGIKDRTEETISGTLFAVNDTKGYNHMMNISFPLSLLEKQDGKLTGRLYAYIPLHNVSEKYFKFDYKR